MPFSSIKYINSSPFPQFLPSLPSLFSTHQSHFRHQDTQRTSNKNPNSLIQTHNHHHNHNHHATTNPQLPPTTHLTHQPPSPRPSRRPSPPAQIPGLDVRSVRPRPRRRPPGYRGEGSATGRHRQPRGEEGSWGSCVLGEGGVGGEG
jgi:hypothetical protein